MTTPVSSGFPRTWQHLSSGEEVIIVLGNLLKVLGDGEGKPEGVNDVLGSLGSLHSHTTNFHLPCVFFAIGRRKGLCSLCV